MLLRLSRLFLSRVLVAGFAVIAGGVLAGCGSAPNERSPGGVDVQPSAVTEQRTASPAPARVDLRGSGCDEFYEWRDAQDALDFDSSLEELDEDLDGIACNELAEAEYQEAWGPAYVEACDSVFADSPDGFLYSSGAEYQQIECEGTDPGSPGWDGDTFDEPAESAARDAWQTACEEFFVTYVGDDLYWGDDEVIVTQSDCENNSPYY
ncbi:MAG: hypothetical protein R3C15_19665 [Thermoleophilia bacterium]